MKPERWKQIEDFYQAALERPEADRPAFLADACPDDEPMRRDVQSLLDASEADDFLEKPATMTGVSIGGYELRTLLGAGGMGEVYLARDSALGRDVAIKILPHAFSSDPQRLARFEREARLLASLNHPNICAIYGFEEADGVRFLILELVLGETLAEKLNRSRGLSLSDALAIARQIAEALETAHERGIVHRDLKPANIKITPDGVVKVLDFGLAKISGDVSSGAGHDTIEGLILGTAAYMSPEQVRGKPTDKRADIWAFGCVLYEMLTGRALFGGETVSDILGKILERDPDWTALPAATPPLVRRLLLRCLAKDSKQRLRDIGDARIEIDAVATDDGTQRNAAGLPPSLSSAADTTSLRPWLPWLAVLVLAVLVGIWAYQRPPTVNPNPLTNAQFSRFTDWEGTESGAAISPDGKFVAFIADRGGRSDLWLSQVGSGRFLDLTKDFAPLSSANAILRTIGFSGDGSEIWFSEAGDASSPKWLIPLTGGTPRPFLGQGAATPSWSPDDTHLTYFMNGGGDPMYLADQTSADARAIPVDMPGFFATGIHNHNPTWSPDGQWLYFAHGPEPTEEMNVWRMRPAGGTPQQLTRLHAAANFVAPIDARTLLYVARAQDRSGPWLWSLDVETGTTQRTISGVENYSSVSASRDGRRVVATVTRPSAKLWRVPLAAGQALPSEERDVESYTVPGSRAFAPRFGGSSLFYLSGSGAGDGLWRSQGSDAVEVWKSTNESLSDPPAVAVDGSRVAIVVRQEGKLRLSVMSAVGTNGRTLAPSLTMQSSAMLGTADWSPDGKWIVAAAADTQGPGVFKIPVDGGSPVRLASGQVTSPAWSPDGRLIVYGGAPVGGQVPLLGVTPDGKAVSLPNVRARLGGGHRFLPDGSGLVYLPRGVALDFWLLDFSTGKTRPLTHLADHGTLRSFDIARDGKFIVFDRLLEQSDIVLIELPRN